MADEFYPFVDNPSASTDTSTNTNTPPLSSENLADQLQEGETTLHNPVYAARIAVYDDMAMPPRIEVIEPKDIRTYLSEITNKVYELMSQQGGTFAFMMIRELVENFIHAAFIEPTISILDKGKTIVFSDQGPGIPNKTAAMKPSFTSATREMKHFIRGVGSGLPIVEEYLKEKHGTLTIDDNLGRGTIVTITLMQPDHEQRSGDVSEDRAAGVPMNNQTPINPQASQMTQAAPGVMSPAQQMPGYPAQIYPGGYPYPYPPAYPPAVQAGYPTGYPYPYPQPTYPQAGMAQPPQQAPAAAWPTYEHVPPTPTGDVPPTRSARIQEDTTATGKSIALTEEEASILLLFNESEAIGPKELNAALHIPNATGTRRLQKLSSMGYVIKRGQKYLPTTEGQHLIGRLTTNKDTARGM